MSQANGLQFELAAVLLAAGRSSRMGRPKMLLPWGKTSVLGHLITLWKELAAAQVAVVCASDDALIAEELDRLGYPGDARILNPDPDRGMFSSIQCAVQWSGWRTSVTHWAIALGDQPHLQTATLEALVRFASENSGNVCQPSRHARARHPVILPKQIFRQVAKSKAADLKEFLESLSASGKTRLIELNNPGLDLDIDRPEDYRKALALWAKVRGLKA